MVGMVGKMSYGGQSESFEMLLTDKTCRLIGHAAEFAICSNHLFQFTF